jgi:hypothetical protein
MLEAKTQNPRAKSQEPMAVFWPTANSRFSSLKASDLLLLLESARL